MMKRIKKFLLIQLRARGSDVLPGDVFLSNHPLAGGSHLPDLTVITPVFWEYVRCIKLIQLSQKFIFFYL